MAGMALRSRSSLDRTVFLMGRSVPVVAVALVATIFLASLAAVVTLRGGSGLFVHFALLPRAVWEGQLWRLLTWPLAEPSDPISLVFACLVLWWTGRDLASSWGGAWFLGFFFALAAATGLVVTLLAGVWPALMTLPHLTAWPVAEGLIIAWALQNRSRQILFYFVLPLSGMQLVWATVGLTALFSLFSGLDRFLPHFVAEGLTLAYLRGLGLRTLWLRLRYRLTMRRLERNWGHLRPVDPPEREGSRWLH